MIAVTVGMRERHLVVADDWIAEVSDPERPIGPEFHLHWAESGIIAGQKVRLAHRGWRRATPVESIAVDAPGHRIAIEQVPAVLGREAIGRVKRHARDGARTVIIGGDGGRESQAIVLLADAFVVSSRHEKIDGLGV